MSCQGGGQLFQPVGLVQQGAEVGLKRQRTQLVHEAFQRLLQITRYEILSVGITRTYDLFVPAHHDLRRVAAAVRHYYEIRLQLAV